MSNRSKRNVLHLAALHASTEVMDILTNQPGASEVIVERCKPLRFAAEDHRMAEMVEMINSMDH